MSLVPQKLSNDKVDRLRKCYHSGLTTKEAAENVGCYQSTALRWYKKFGYDTDRGKLRLSQGKIDTLKMCYESDLFPKEAAQRVGCSERTALIRFRQLGYSSRRRLLTNQEKEELRNYFNEGLPPSESAKIVGCSESTALTHYKTFGYIPKTTRNTTETGIKLKTCFESGLSVMEAVASVGCAYGTALNHYQSFGYVHKKRRQKINSQKVSELHKCYEDGMTPQEAMGVVNCCETTVIRIYKGFGWAPKNQKLSPEKDSKVAELFKMGIPPQEVSRKIGISYSRVLKSYKRLGYKTFGRSSRLSAENLARLKFHYDSSLSPEAAAAMVGCFEHTAIYHFKKFGWKPNQDIRIRSERALVEFLDTEPITRLVVENFGGDDADVADVLVVLYADRLSREDAMRFMAEPSLREYLGQFQRPLNSLRELGDVAYQLLPLDRDSIIRDIVLRKAVEYRRRKLGPNPTEKQKTDFLKELEEQLVVA